MAHIGTIIDAGLHTGGAGCTRTGAGAADTDVFFGRACDNDVTLHDNLAVLAENGQAVTLNLDDHGFEQERQVDLILQPATALASLPLLELPASTTLF